MNLVNWLRPIAPPNKQKITARWLQPNENLWRLPVLDCTQYAHGITSFTGNSEVAKKYAELPGASGQELPRLDFKPAQHFACNLTYKIHKRPADGPVFKSRVMEEKWDIYLYEEGLFFCRSWSGELIYRAAAKCEPPALIISMVESSQLLPEKLAVRQVDFLIKSHLMLATALHPLPADLGRDAEKQATNSFSWYGAKGRYGTLEETIGTAYYWNQSPLTDR
jgi:hypothetical protein